MVDLVDEFSDGRIQFAFVKVKDPNTSLPKNVLIAWVRHCSGYGSATLTPYAVRRRCTRADKGLFWQSSYCCFQASPCVLTGFWSFKHWLIFSRATTFKSLPAPMRTSRQKRSSKRSLMHPAPNTPAAQTFPQEVLLLLPRRSLFSRPHRQEEGVLDSTH